MKRKNLQYHEEEKILLMRLIKSLWYQNIYLGRLHDAEYILDSLSIERKNELIESLDDKYLDIEPIIFNAIERDCIKSIKFLLQNRVSLNVFNNQGLNPIQVALYQKKFHLIEILLNEDFDINILNPEQLTGDETTLHTASKIGSLRTVIILINKGAKIDAVDHYGDTPLHESISKNYIDITRFLILNGADIHIENDKKSTASNIAQKKNYIQIQEDLQTTTAIENILSFDERQTRIDLNIYYERDNKWFIEVLKYKLLDKFKSSEKISYIQCLMKVVHDNLKNSDLDDHNLIDILTKNQLITHIYKEYDKFLECEILPLKYIASIKILSTLDTHYMSSLPNYLIETLIREISIRTDIIWDDQLEEMKIEQDQPVLIGEHESIHY